MWPPSTKPDLQERLAFIGLGALGAPMAANLIRAGFPLTLHNRSRGREVFVLEMLEGSESNRAGEVGVVRSASTPVQCAASPAEAVANADIVCLCLSDDAAVQEVLLGQAAPGSLGGGISASADLHESRVSAIRTGRTELQSRSNTSRPRRATAAALAHLRPGALVIDFSTIAPATSRALATRLAEQQVAYIDAPVTGGTEGARAGTLSVLVGGEPTDLERARPVLEVVGGRITHIGPVGAGQEAKAVNQVLVAGSYAAVAEAVALGQRLGLPMERVLNALKSGAAGSWALEHRSTNMLTGTFPLGFKLALHHKDLAIALKAAATASVELPITERVAAIERELMEAGFGEEDVSALARFYLRE